MNLMDDPPASAANGTAPLAGGGPPMSASAAATAKKRKKKAKKKKADDGAPVAGTQPLTKAAADAAWAAGVDALVSGDEAELWVRLAGAGVADARARKVSGRVWHVYVCVVREAGTENVQSEGGWR